MLRQRTGEDVRAGPKGKEKEWSTGLRGDGPPRSARHSMARGGRGWGALNVHVAKLDCMASCEEALISRGL